MLFDSALFVWCWWRQLTVGRLYEWAYVQTPKVARVLRLAG
jgi:hypothetical protein